MTEFADVHPQVRQRLAGAVQFLDAFTRAPVRVPLRVSVPGLQWTAVASEADATYRFLQPRSGAHTGPFEVAVTAPGGEYVSFEAISLPDPSTLPTPPRRRDYLLQPLLWPTPRLRLAEGETAVLGRLVSTGGATPTEGLTVRVSGATAGAPPPSPYTRSNAAGEFLFRLPALKVRLSGGTVVNTAVLRIEVRTPAGTPVPVTLPPAPPLPAGTFEVPLGRVTSLPFSIP